MGLNDVGHAASELLHKFNRVICIPLFGEKELQEFIPKIPNHIGSCGPSGHRMPSLSKLLTL